MKEILEAKWRVDKVSASSRWVRCDLGTEGNVPVAHIGANHDEETADAIAKRIVEDHNKSL